MKFMRTLPIALLTALLAACGGGAKEHDRIVLGFSQIGAESEWRTANTVSIQTAAKDMDIDLRCSDAQQKQENQIKALRLFIAQKVDVIAFSPVVETGWDSVLREAKAANVPVLYAHNDDMAIGAIQAIEEAGLRPAKDIHIVSIDAVKGAFDAMIAGKLNATVECNPLLGPQLMTSVAEAVAGRPIPKRIVVDEQVFTMETAKQHVQSRKY